MIVILHITGIGSGSVRLDVEVLDDGEAVVLEVNLDNLALGVEIDTDVHFLEGDIRRGFLKLEGEGGLVARHLVVFDIEAGVILIIQPVELLGAVYGVLLMRLSVVIEIEHLNLCRSGDTHEQHEPCE